MKEGISILCYTHCIISAERALDISQLDSLEFVMETFGKEKENSSSVEGIVRLVLCD